MNAPDQHPDVSLQSALSDRVRPWHLLDVAAFLFGAVGSIQRATPGVDGLTGLPVVAITGISLLAAVTAVVSGLFAVVVLRVTVGSLWGYAVEYTNAGGQWSDRPLLVPVGSGLVAVVATYAVTERLGAAAWAGVAAFALAAGVVAVAASFAAGYRDSAA